MDDELLAILCAVFIIPVICVLFFKYIVFLMCFLEVTC